MRKNRKIIFSIIFVFVLSILLSLNNLSASSNERFTKLKTNSNYTYNLSHDRFISELSRTGQVKIYFNLSKLSDKKLKASFLWVVKDLRRLNSKRIKLYTEIPQGSYHEVAIIDYNNGARCTPSSVIACANAGALVFNKKATTYNSARQKGIITHELFHVFGLDHVASKTKGSIMTSALPAIKSFSIKNYPKEVNAWHTLNNPYRSYKVNRSGSVKVVKFINIYTKQKHIYSIKTVKKGKGKKAKKRRIYSIKQRHYFGQTGKYLKETRYYNNSKKLYKRTIREGKAPNYINANYFYEKSGRFLKSSNHYNKNRKIIRKVYYSSKAGSKVVSQYQYDASGRYLNEVRYYRNGIVHRKIKYTNQANNEKQSEYYYERTGRYYTAVLTYQKGLLKNKEVYHGIKENKLMVKYYYELSGQYIIEAYYYNQSGQVIKYEKYNGIKPNRIEKEETFDEGGNMIKTITH